MAPPYVVGVTGGVCAGKSTVAGLIADACRAKLSVSLLDCGRCAHLLFLFFSAFQPDS